MYGRNCRGVCISKLCRIDQSVGAVVDNPNDDVDDPGMSQDTLSFALPEALRAFIDARVASGDYGTASDYIRDLIRKDLEEQARERLRGLIGEGLASPPGQPHGQDQVDAWLALARGEVD